MTASLTADGITAVTEGDLARGRALLLEVVRINAVDATAWTWLARAVEHAPEQRYCLMQALAADPSLFIAQQDMQRLGPGPATPPGGLVPPVVPAEAVSSKSDNRQTVGLIGVAMLAVGVFTPLVTVPLAGSITYFSGGQGDGILVLGLAFVALLITLSKHYRWLWLPGLGSLGLIGNSFLRIVAVRSGMIRIEWGTWLLLVVGALLVIGAAVIKPKS